MSTKISLKVLIWIVSILVSILLLVRVVIEPLAGKRIQSLLSEKNKEYQVEIKQVRISIFSKSIELRKIEIHSNKEKPGIRADIASIKLAGVSIIKALIKKDIHIMEIIISEANIKGKVPPEKNLTHFLSIPQNISIDRIIIDEANMSVGNTLSAKLLSVSHGYFKLYDLQINKNDTLSFGLIKNYDFEASEIGSTTSDSMYTFTSRNFVCSSTSRSISSETFSIHPNYTDYDFTSRYKYQKDRIEADLSNISAYSFNVAEYFRSGNLTVSYLEIGNMDMKVFRDKRKEFRHITKKTFQELIYSYPALLNIDSIRLLNGSIRYTEHALDANSPGHISFEKIQAEISKITNNPIYKTRKEFLILRCDALFMGKGRLSILQKSIIFDNKNMFTLDGTLTQMEANEMNPFLDKNAFIYITSGKVDGIKFSFKADDTRATGILTMRYHDLDITVKNRHTDDTTAFKEKFLSMIVNLKIIDSNPVAGEGLRVGIIDYERDPEKFLFSYWVKSVASGIKSVLVKSQKK